MSDERFEQEEPKDEGRRGSQEALDGPQTRRPAMSSARNQTMWKHIASIRWPANTAASDESDTDDSDDVEAHRRQS